MTVGAAKSYAASQDHVRPELTRKGTLTGMGALKPPLLPGELAATLKAPPRAPLKETWNVPAPPLAVALARRTPVPPRDDTPEPGDVTTGQPEASLPPPSKSPEAATVAALRRRAEAAEAKTAELERQSRVKTEAASPATYPPAVTPSPAKPIAVSSAEPQADEVVTWLVKRAVANRKAIYGIIAALGIGGGGVAIKTANEKPQPAPLTAAQLDAALDKLKTRKGGFDDQTRLLNEQLQLTKCMRRKMVQIGESVLPAPDHMGSTRKPQPFEDDCPDSPKPLPDP